MRLGIGSAKAQLQSARSRNIDLVADGEIHTETLTLRELRNLSGYLQAMGLYFEKNGGVGDSVTLISVKFITEAEAE